jgi:hypothetical protein
VEGIVVRVNDRILTTADIRQPSISWSKIEETDLIQLIGEKAGRIFPRVRNLKQGVDPEDSREPPDQNRRRFLQHAEERAVKGPSS